MARITIGLLLVVLAALAAAVVAVVWGYGQYSEPGKHLRPINVVIEPGSGVEAIAERLARAGAIEQPAVFRLGVRVSGIHRDLKAGEFAIPPRASPRQIARLLVDGRTVVHRLTVVEGATTQEVLAQILANEVLSGPIDGGVGEGALLPETYHFSREDSRSAMLGRMIAGMDAKLAELWPQRAEGLPLASPAEAVILASIVEKETALARERSRVAAVFINRLRRGMRLQSDPTVVYALTQGAAPLDRPLTRADLQTDSPYNTYTADGLPPGPICNPGADAIAAVLNPMETDELYFVADGSGGHAFAKTLDEHNRNVRQWRRFQRQSQP